MVKAGKAAGMGALALSVSVLGILGVNSLSSGTTSASTQSSTVTLSSAHTPTTRNHACAPHDESIPADANQAKTIDLDGDGRADTLWNSGDEFGVRTASGATFSGKFANAGGPEASVEAVKLGDGSKVIMELGRQDYVNAVIDCRIVPTKNEQGDQYSFDHGFQTEGSNWAFAKINGKKQLVGLQLKTISEEDGFYGVDETLVVLHDHGRTATNGTIRALKHNGRVFMSNSTATERIASIVDAGQPATIVTTPGT